MFSTLYNPHFLSKGGGLKTDHHLKENADQILHAVKSRLQARHGQ